MKITALPFEALLSKLRNTSTGFNRQIANKAALYRLKPWTLDFPADVYGYSTKNFFLGPLNPANLADQGPVGHNRAWMYSTSTDNLNFEKPNDFSGLVRVSLDFNLEWTASASSQNFLTPSLLVEDAVSEIIQPSNQQDWGSGVVYNGEFACQRSTVEQTETGSGLSLRQIVLFKLTFQLSV